MFVTRSFRPPCPAPGFIAAGFTETFPLAPDKIRRFTGGKWLRRFFIFLFSRSSFAAATGFRHEAGQQRGKGRDGFTGIPVCFQIHGIHQFAVRYFRDILNTAFRKTDKKGLGSNRQYLDAFAGRKGQLSDNPYIRIIRGAGSRAFFEQIHNTVNSCAYNDQDKNNP
jgi:hypothetical protein